MSTDIIDTDQLTRKAGEIAKDMIGKEVQGAFGYVDNKADLVKQFGVKGDWLDNLIKSFKDMVQNLMETFGLSSAPSAHATITSSTASEPASANPAAAQAAAQAAAAGANVAKGTDVTSPDAPAATPPQTASLQKTK